MCIFNMSCLNLPVEGPLQACSKAYILRLAGSNPLESGWPGRRQMILATTRRVSRIGGRVQTSSSALSLLGDDRSSLWWTLRGTFFDSSPRLFVVAIPSLITFGWDVTESRPEEKWRIGLIRFELVHTGKAARVPGGSILLPPFFSLHSFVEFWRGSESSLCLYTRFSAWLTVRGSCKKDIQWYWDFPLGVQTWVTFSGQKMR